MNFLNRIAYEVLKELIDTLWNVNYFDTGSSTGTSSELIDTLWNVNLYLLPVLPNHSPELIDTLWNVNNNFLSKLLIVYLN